MGRYNKTERTHRTLTCFNSQKENINVTTRSLPTLLLPSHHQHMTVNVAFVKSKTSNKKIRSKRHTRKHVELDVSFKRVNGTKSSGILELRPADSNFEKLMSCRVCRIPTPDGYCKADFARRLLNNTVYEALYARNQVFRR